MLSALFRKLVDLSPNISRWMWKCFYNVTATVVPNKSLKFMNYGYADLDCKAGSYEELSWNLYQQLLDAIPHHSEHRLVEVGCGRGGACEKLLAYPHQEIIGIDFASKAIQFCKKNYPASIQFKVGNALDLPLADASVDVLINIESAHCYGSKDASFKEVYRVLKPGGYFLFADFTFRINENKVSEQLAKAGIPAVHFQDISLNVLHSMQITQQDRAKHLQKFPFNLFKSVLKDFVGLPDSTIFKQLKSQELIYFSILAQK